MVKKVRLVVRIWEFPVEVIFVGEFWSCVPSWCGWGPESSRAVGDKCGLHTGVAGGAPCCGCLGVELGKLEPSASRPNFDFGLP